MTNAQHRSIGSMIMFANNYLNDAQENEEVFRNILRDLKMNRGIRPMGGYIPTDLETEIPLKEIFFRYSPGNRMGVFTIFDFKVDGKSAIIHFENITAMSSGGASFKYRIKKDNQVAYFETIMIIRS